MRVVVLVIGMIGPSKPTYTPATSNNNQMWFRLEFYALLVFDIGQVCVYHRKVLRPSRLRMQSQRLNWDTIDML